MLLNTFFVNALNAMANHALKLDPEYLTLIKTLNGTKLGVEIIDWRIAFVCEPLEDSIRIEVLTDEASTDICMKGKLFDLVKLARAKSPQLVLKEGHVKYEGSLLLLEDYQKITQQFDADWEALLSRYFGGVVAHQIMKQVKGIAKWHIDLFSHAKTDVTQYLQEEARAIVGQEEIEDFIDDVRVLRYDLNRVEAKLKRLEGVIDVWN